VVWAETRFCGVVFYLGLHGLGENGLKSLVGWFGVGTGYSSMVRFLSVSDARRLSLSILSPRDASLSRLAMAARVS
jgi:hypothetical protein